MIHSLWCDLRNESSKGNKIVRPTTDCDLNMDRKRLRFRYKKWYHEVVGDEVSLIFLFPNTDPWHSCRSSPGIGSDSYEYFRSDPHSNRIDLRTPVHVSDNRSFSLYLYSISLPNLSPLKRNKRSHNIRINIISGKMWCNGSYIVTLK